MCTIAPRISHAVAETGKVEPGHNRPGSLCSLWHALTNHAKASYASNTVPNIGIGAVDFHAYGVFARLAGAATEPRAIAICLVSDSRTAGCYDAHSRYALLAFRIWSLLCYRRWAQHQTRNGHKQHCGTGTHFLTPSIRTVTAACCSRIDVLTNPWHGRRVGFPQQLRFRQSLMQPIATRKLQCAIQFVDFPRWAIYGWESNPCDTSGGNPPGERILDVHRRPG